MGDEGESESLVSTTNYYIETTLNIYFFLRTVRIHLRATFFFFMRAIYIFSHFRRHHIAGGRSQGNYVQTGWKSGDRNLIPGCDFVFKFKNYIVDESAITIVPCAMTVPHAIVLHNAAIPNFIPLFYYVKFTFSQHFRGMLTNGCYVMCLIESTKAYYYCRGSRTIYSYCSRESMHTTLITIIEFYTRFFLCFAPIFIITIVPHIKRCPNRNANVRRVDIQISYTLVKVPLVFHMNKFSYKNFCAINKFIFYFSAESHLAHSRNALIFKLQNAVFVKRILHSMNTFYYKWWNPFELFRFISQKYTTDIK